MACAALALQAVACSDEGEPTGGAAGSGQGGAGAEGGFGGATSTSSEGGAGGEGGTGGEGGGSAAKCLPKTEYEALITLNATELCVTAIYTADVALSYQLPSWGAHGGPAIVAPGPQDGEVTFTRLTAPKGAEGAMTVANTTVAAAIPAGAYLGGQALDLGFRPGTLVSYAGAFPNTEGEILVATESAATERYPVNAFFAAAAFPTAAGGRIVYSALSPLGDDKAGQNGLYSADDCNGDFTPQGQPMCTASKLVSAWGDASGPVVVDTQGNVVALMTSFDGDQEARAFAKNTIAEGAAATSGDSLFVLPGFGQALAAIAPAGSAPGICAFQPFDGTSFAALDVVAVHYTVEANAVVPDGEPKPLITPAVAGTALTLLSDPTDRLWVGVPTKEGQNDTTTFLVLSRTPE